jgi:hypothetical protein
MCYFRQTPRQSDKERIELDMYHKWENTDLQTFLIWKKENIL